MKASNRAGDDHSTVARMERSDIRGLVHCDAAPDFAALNPGYGL
jgi:hypothetical protein